MTSQIKITQLTNIGSGNIATTTLLPVVNMAGVPTTQKTTLGNLANVILSQAGSNYAPASLSNVAYSVSNAAQPNITSVGTLTSVSVTGNATIGNVTTGGLLTATGNITGGNVTTAGKVSAGTLSVTGTTNLGAVANVTITGGTNGQVLTTNGSNVLSWTTVSGGGGNATPGGSNTQIQFNDAGTFNGNSGFTFNKTAGSLASPMIDTALIYHLNGTIIENSDLTHGPTAAVIVPSNGNTTSPVQITNTYGNIGITAGTNSSNLQNWNFNNDGNFTLPNGTRIGNIDGNNAVGVDVVANSQFMIQTNDGNGFYGWFFNEHGSMVVPATANSEATIQSYANNGNNGSFLRLVTDVNSSLLIGTSNNNHVVLNIDRKGANIRWIYDNDGYLNLPGNTFSMKYANGTQVPLDSIQSKIANGTSNVNIATSGGAVTVNAGSANAWTFGTDGTLTTTNSSQIVPAGNNFNLYTYGVNGAVQFFTDVSGNNHNWSFDGYGYTNLPFTQGYTDTAVITTNGAGSLMLQTGAGPTQNFLFSSDGSLTIPAGDANTVGSGQIFSGNESSFINLDVQFDSNILGGMRLGTSGTVPVDIATGNGSGGFYTWRFDNEGWFAFPASNGYAGGGAIGYDATSDSLQTTFEGNITLNNAGGTWTFDTTSQLSTPDGTLIGAVEGPGTFGFYNANNTNFLIEGPNNITWSFDTGTGNTTVPGPINGGTNASVTLNALNNGDAPSVQILNWDVANSAPSTLISVNPNNVEIVSGITTPSPKQWTLDNTGNLELPTISLGSGVNEQSVIRSQRKVIPPFRYSAVVDGSTPTTVYIAEVDSVTIKTTLVVQHSGLGFEMFDVSAVAAGANIMYSISNRINATGQADTTAVVEYMGSQLVITLTVNSGATTSWVTYDSTEFGIAFD